MTTAPKSTPRTCEIDWCGKPRQARGRMCAMHAARRRKGIPMDQPPRIISDLETRFWSKVRGGDIDTCWEWTASLNDAGYGQFMLNGRPQRAHRIAYEMLRAEIPDDLHIDHLCRNRACVNPWHLEPVTIAENNRRAPQTIVLRTECPSGHKYSPENTRIDTDGYRRCRTCERTQSLAGYYRRKSKAVV